jgi:hypothetical protein
MTVGRRIARELARLGAAETRYRIEWPEAKVATEARPTSARPEAYTSS